MKTIDEILKRYNYVKQYSQEEADKYLRSELNFLMKRTNEIWNARLKKSLGQIRQGYSSVFTMDDIEYGDGLEEAKKEAREKLETIDYIIEELTGLDGTKLPSYPYEKTLKEIRLETK